MSRKCRTEERLQADDNYPNLARCPQYYSNDKETRLTCCLRVGVIDRYSRGRETGVLSVDELCYFRDSFRVNSIKSFSANINQWQVSHQLNVHIAKFTYSVHKWSAVLLNPLSMPTSQPQFMLLNPRTNSSEDENDRNKYTP